jgi:hypothetical protein
LHLDDRATQPPGLTADTWANRLRLKPPRYDRGVDLLTSAVAMLMQMM